MFHVSCCYMYHVFDEQELRLNNELSIITSFVVRQASVTLEQYKVQLEVNLKNNVLKLKCFYNFNIIF